MSGCDNDIFTLHAPLIHKARDVEFQFHYENGVATAFIADINEKNVQFALEKYFSLVGIPVVNEIPIGSKDCVNLTFLTAYEFIPNTLEVNLSGIKLNGNQSDTHRDYDVITSGVNTNRGFTLRLEPNDPNRLNCPPFKDEPLTVSYAKRITFNTKGGT